MIYDVLREILKRAKEEFKVKETPFYFDNRQDKILIRNILRDTLDKVFKSYIEKIALTKKGWSIDAKKEQQPLYIYSKIVIHELEKPEIESLTKELPLSSYERQRVYRNAERLIKQYCNEIE